MIHWLGFANQWQRINHMKLVLRSIFMIICIYCEDYFSSLIIHYFGQFLSKPMENSPLICNMALLVYCNPKVLCIVQRSIWWKEFSSASSQASLEDGNPLERISSIFSGEVFLWCVDLLSKIRIWDLLIYWQ